MMLYYYAIRVLLAFLLLSSASLADAADDDSLAEVSSSPQLIVMPGLEVLDGGPEYYCLTTRPTPKHPAFLTHIRPAFAFEQAHHVNLAACAAPGVCVCVCSVVLLHKA